MISFQELYGDMEATVQLDKETRSVMFFERTGMNANKRADTRKFLSTYCTGLNSYKIPILPIETLVTINF